MLKHRLGHIALCVCLLLLITTSAMAAGTKITIGFPGSTDVQPILDRFNEKYPDIEVEPLLLEWGAFFEKLPAMIASGTGPDVWYGEAGRALGWRHQGITADLGRFVERDLELEDYFFLDAARDRSTGEWTGIPSDFQVTALFYNTLHFSNSGIPFPTEEWTTDNLIEAGKRLTVSNGDTVERYGFHLNGPSITTGWLLWTHLLGGHILDETRTKSRLNDPATVDAWDFMRSLAFEERISPTQEEVRQYSFANGTASMEFNIYVRNNINISAGMDTFDVQMIPRSTSGKRFTTAVPNVWVINEGSSPDKKEAAWNWIKFIVSEEEQVIRMAEGSGVPVNRSVGQTAFLDAPPPPANRQVFVESYAFAGTLEENVVWDRYRRAINPQVSQVMSGTVSAQAAAINAHEQVSAILSEVYK